MTLSGAWRGMRLGLAGTVILACAGLACADETGSTNALPSETPVVTTNTPVVVVATNQPPDAVATNDALTVNPPFRSMGFEVGEELDYEIYWGVIPVGSSRITTEWIEEDGRKLVAIRYRTRSNKVVASLYPVNDRIEAIIDPTTFLPVRFEKDLREGRNRIHELTTFDYKNLKGHWKSLIKDKSKEFDIEPDTRDLVTFMYYMRSQDFRIGEQSHYRVMSDEKLYDLYFNVKEAEPVKLDGYGRVPSLRIDPRAAFEGLFVHKGNMVLWVSADARKICTQMKAEVPVASVNVKLVAVRGPGDDVWIKRAPKIDEPGSPRPRSLGNQGRNGVN